MKNEITELRNEDFVGKHNFLAESLLVPNVNKTDCNRLVMFTSQFSQCEVTDNMETPLIYSSFENQIGKYTLSGYKKIKEDSEILCKIVKNDFNYYLVVKDKDGNFDLIERKECKWLTEHYGFRYNNDVLDSKETGDKLKKGEVIYRNGSYDDDMNFAYGNNLKAIYTTYKNMTYEDAIVIAESVGEKFSYHDVQTFNVSVNTNDLLLNLYGTGKNIDGEIDYKCFPDIGEEIKLGKLLSRRRIDYSEALYKLKNLKEDTQSDTTYFCNGVVVDINVYCNEDIEKLEKQAYNRQIVKYIKMKRKFDEKVVEKLKDIIERKENFPKLSEELINFYNKSKMALDNNYYSYQNNRFDNFNIEFTIMEKKKVGVGSKIANRYGGKGVISLVVPDDEMPVIKEGPFKGERAEICLSPNGVFNRLNPSQLYELEINFISKYIRNEIKNSNSLQEKASILITYYSRISEEEEQDIIEFLNSINDNEKEEFFNDIVENGIPVKQKPFWDNITLEKLASLYEYYPEVKPFKFEDIEEELIMGEIYMMCLKHHPEGKLSMRSTDFNNLKDLPSKGKAFKDHQAPYSTTPIRMGEMEITNLLLTKDTKAVDDLLRTYANDERDRKILLEDLILGDPFATDVKTGNYLTNTNKITRAFFRCLGIELERGDDE